jgi:hypothetical protein
MKNENIFSIIINNLYINELSKLKFDTKNLTLLKNISKTLLDHKWKSFNVPDKEEFVKHSNEIAIKYSYKHKAIKSKHHFESCFSSIAYIDVNTLTLGTYFNFNIFLYKLKENILEKIIAGEESKEQENVAFFYTKTLEGNAIRVKTKTGRVDKITVIDDYILSAYDGLNHNYYICDYVNKAIVKVLSINAVLLKI